MRNLLLALGAFVLALALAPAAHASGSAVDQFSAVKYIRNLSDLACQYRDHGLSLQLDGHNYEWLIFSDSHIRRNMEAELVLLGRSREHIIDPLAWQLHVDMLNTTIEQINTITDELDTYNFRDSQTDIVERIGRTANDGSSILGDIEDELAKGEERNYADLATYGEKLWMIGNDLICLVKDLEFENWTALYSGDLGAGDSCQNQFTVAMACWDCNAGCSGGCPSVSTACVQGKECGTKSCPKPNCKACKTKKCGCGKTSCRKCGRP
jgi:hypothetical protein